MGKTVGIDLGTTNSVVSVLEGSRPTVIPNNEGSRTTPSMVAFAEGGERLMGHVAKRQAVTNAVNTVYSVKRFIGRRFSEDQTQSNIKRMPYQIIESDRGDASVDIDGETYSPAEISAMILTNMKEIAEEYLSDSVTDAVITVPAYFDDSQRQATRDAGKIAGLNVERIINEPTAAALAYGVDKKEDRKIAVYDLGGGTFDIAIMELAGDVFNVLSISGDTYLGGDDFDNRIIDVLAEQFKEENQTDLREEPMSLQRLKEAAEKAKHELSSSLETEINLPFISADDDGPKHLTRTMTREELEELTGDLVERSVEICQKAIEEAELELKDIEEVLLVGGQTRMPLVQQKVKDFFEKEPNREINPDEVVSIGAALQGAVISGDIKNVLLLDVTPLSLGIETAGGMFTAQIGRNTTVPTKKAEVFTTARDNQSLVNVHVLQGERPMAVDNKTLARFELLGIPPAPRGVPQIEVYFEIDANGIVNVSAKDLGTGKHQKVRITDQCGLNENEVQAIIEDSEAHRHSDEQKRKEAEMVINAEGLIYTTEKSLEEYASSLDADDLELIQNDLDELKTALESKEIKLIEQNYKALETSSYRIAETIYAQG